MRATFRHPVKLISTLILSLGLGAAAHAAETASCPPQPQPITTQEEAQALMAQAKDRGLMFKVTKGEVTHYLYGTMHVGKREWVMPGARMLEALRMTKQLALELNLTDPAILKGMTDPEAYFLNWNNLPPALKTSLVQQLKATCAADETMKQPPSLAAIRLSLMPMLQQGLHGEFGSEAILIQTSMQLRRPILGLEQPKDQLGALQGDNKQEALEALTDMTNPKLRAKSAKVADILVESWEKGDLAKLEEYEKWCDCVKTERERKAMNRLLGTRNVKMADAIDSQLGQGPATLIGVGALHLIGPKGLPSLLRDKGYTVELMQAVAKP